MSTQGCRSALSSSRGMVLVEVLVTATVVAVGVLGLAQIQGRTAVAAVEAQQRTQALLLAYDMADRMLANRSRAAEYVGSDYGLAIEACDTSSAVARDRCAWSAAIAGASERIGTTLTGGLLNGRGCVLQTGARRYRVVIAWQGMTPTVVPSSDCARGAYGAETRRRALVVPVELPDLSAT